jgi:O-antigen/teichoic acid export membrane protein
MSERLPIAGQSAGRRIVRNGALNVTAFAINAGLNLLALIFLARRLPEDVFGRYCTAYAIMILVQLVTEAGIPTVLMCRIAAAPLAWKKAAEEALGLLGYVVLAAWFLCFAFSVGMGWPVLVGVLMSSAVAGIHVQRFCAGVFGAHESFEYECLARVVQSGAFAALVMLLLEPGTAGLVLPLGLFAASQGIAALIMATSLARHWPCLPAWPRLHTLRDWLAHTGPVGVGDVVRRLASQVDVLILGLFQAPAVVAVYSIAVRPLSTVNWLPQTVLAGVLPSFARAAAQDRESLQRVFTTTTRVAGIVAVPVAAALYWFAEPIVVIIAGRDYLAAAVPMRIVAGNAILISLSAPLRFLLVALGVPRWYSASAVAGLLVEIAALFVLIPRFGYFGACAAIMLGELAYLVAGSVAGRAELARATETGSLLEEEVAQEAGSTVSV